MDEITNQENLEATPQKKQMTVEQKKFLLKLSLYVFFGAIIPFIFLVFRFKLFRKVSTLSIGGWGLIAIIIVAVFFIRMIKIVKKGLPYSPLTQILTGLCKVTIPLIVCAFITYYFRDMMDYMFQLFFVLIICETIAMAINPLPKWAHDNKIEEDESTIKRVLSSLGIGKNEEGTKQ